MNRKHLSSLYKKEIMDVIRDKKTLLVMIVLPLILYPLLFIVILQVITMINTSETSNEYKYAYVGKDSITVDAISKLNNWIDSDDNELEYDIKLSVKYIGEDEKTLNEALNKEKIDAYIKVSEKYGQVFYKINYLSSVSNSANCESYLTEELEGLNEESAKEKISESGLDVDSVLYPVVCDSVDKASGEEAMGNVLGSVIPFLLITSVLMGCVYPAIDATSGEKERGTLETLLTCPINNLELIMSKFLSVATIAAFSVFINMISVGGIAVYLYLTMKSLSSKFDDFNFSTFIPALIIVIFCILAFALFMSAVVMCICAFAKSFKEANNYVSPIMIVVLLVGYVGFIPNVKLTTTMSLIPVVNVVLLLKNLLAFKYEIGTILLVLMSNIVYAGITVWFLSRIYDSESILFGESLGNMRIFERRINIKKNSIPSPMDALFVYIIVLIGMIYVGGVLGLKSVLMSVFIPQGLIILVPLLAVIYMKGDIKKIYLLKLPKIRHLLGSIVLFAGTWCLTSIVGAILSQFFPNAEMDATESYMAIVESLPFVGGVLVIALLPAVVEELFFRGFILSSFKNRMNPFAACVAVSFLFACIHMLPIRILPIMVLSMGLCYSAYKSESIITSSCMHFLNNFISVIALYYPKKVEFISNMKFDTPLKVIGFLLIGVLLFVIGLLIIHGRPFRVKEEKA